MGDVGDEAAGGEKLMGDDGEAPATCHQAESMPRVTKGGVRGGKMEVSVTKGWCERREDGSECHQGMVWKGMGW